MLYVVSSGLVGLLGCTEPPQTDGPIDSSQAGIEAFLEDEGYRESPWIAQTEAPRESTWEVSPHGRVHLWLNETVIASQAAGNGGFLGTPHTTGSMAVKELVDESDVPVGRAVMLKLEGVAASWVYYCDGTEERCGFSDGEPPHYAVAYDSECYYCHGGEIFNARPE
ncbi:MAG: hypothetical protein ACI8RZ_004308 [Myxococcota bacterium]|jgi:hypothetical protein